MEIDIRAVDVAERPLLVDLLQRYIDEMRAYDPSIRAEGEAYVYPGLDAYFGEPGRYPYFVRVDDHVVGFALVLCRPDGTTEMAELFVRPSHRRTGVGLSFARELIARFPGPWELSQYRASTSAIAFWREVLAGRDYVEHTYVSANGNPRIAQRFTV